MTDKIIGRALSWYCYFSPIGGLAEPRDEVVHVNRQGKSVFVKGRLHGQSK